MGTSSSPLAWSLGGQPSNATVGRKVRDMLHRDLVVVVNGRNLGEQLPRHELQR
jgi:hypothetical protein